MRIDDGVREGDAISPFYDSMIAKLIVHGATREEALARLDEALARTHIVGLATNVQFLRHVVQSRSFAQADLDTALIQRERAVLFHQEPVGLPLAAAAAVAAHAARRARARERTTRSAAATAGARTASRRAASTSSSAASRRRPSCATCTTARCTWRSSDAAGPLVFCAAPARPSTCSSPATRTLARVYASGETDHVFTPQGATQIVAIDLLAHAGEGAGRRRPAHRADARQGRVVRRQGRRHGEARARRWP